MNRTNRLGILVALITAAVLLVIYGLYWGATRLLKNDQQAQPAAGQASAILEPISDKDADGLSDLVENLYKTKADVADTDSDGTKDGQEVAEGRNPVLAGPNDKLPQVPLASEVLNTSTYTGKYLSTLPADLDQAQILDKTRVEAFVEENRGELLPALPAGTIQASSAAGKEAVQSYLNAISASKNPNLKLLASSQIEEAFRAASADPANSSLRDIKKTLEQNLAELKRVEVPSEVVALHEKLVVATTALISNVALLENMSKDFIGGVIGAKNIELLGTEFNDIAKQIAALEQKYNIE